MSTQQAPREWFGLGQAGWAIFAVIALVNLVVIATTTETLADTAVYGGLIIMTAYVMVRAYKFIYGLLAKILS